MTKEFESFALDYAIVCDQVRREENGKLFLIGVYGGNIVVPTVPAILPVCLALRLRANKAGMFPISVRVTLKANDIMSVSGEFGANDLNWSLVGTPPLLLNIGAEGDLVFQIRDMPTADWVSVMTLPVVVASNPEVLGAHPRSLDPNPSLRRQAAQEDKRSSGM